MTDEKNFNLPAYINIPFFLYQDNRLEKSALLIAAFFYSLHTAGKSIRASKDYLCSLAGIGKTQYFYTLNQLESLGYIQRSGFTNSKKIIWIYSTNSVIIVDEQNTSPVTRTAVKKLPVSSVKRTKLVRVPEPNLSGYPDTDTKEDTKEDKKLTTVDRSQSDLLSSSSFFSEKQTQELLALKVKKDERSDEAFLDNCTHHIEKQTNDLSKFQRIAGLKKILCSLQETKEIFKSSGLDKMKLVETKNETDEERNKRQFFQREIEKEKNMGGYYVSEALKKRPEMREKYA